MDGIQAMNVRPERPQDYRAIADVTVQAFAGEERSARTEPAIVAALRASGALALSLVVTDEDEVIGHAAFSSVTIDGDDRGWFGLGPVSVRPDRQRSGVGSALIRRGLRLLDEGGAAGCVVLGEPAYYRRFGFVNDPALRYHGAPAEYFMRLAFRGEAPAGRVEYHPGFGAR